MGSLSDIVSGLFANNGPVIKAPQVGNAPPPQQATSGDSGMSQGLGKMIGGLASRGGGSSGGTAAPEIASTYDAAGSSDIGGGL